MRCFIAIELEKKHKEAIGRAQKGLMSPDDQVRWIDPANIHLTLKFLGEVAENRILKIGDYLSGIAEVWPDFDFELFGVGAFPNVKMPRIIWVGVNAVSGELVRLAREVDRGMGQLGFQREGRKFAPHLTLGRVKWIKNLGTLRSKLEEQRETPFGKVHVKRISLMKSTLTPQGSIYERIGEYGLL